jgi:hypothetical protein
LNKKGNVNHTLDDWIVCDNINDFCFYKKYMIGFFIKMYDWIVCDNINDFCFYKKYMIG